MSLEERFIKRNGELQQKVKEEIEKVKEGQSERNMVQLQTILSWQNYIKKYNSYVFIYPLKNGIINEAELEVINNLKNCSRRECWREWYST